MNIALGSRLSANRDLTNGKDCCGLTPKVLKVLFVKLQHDNYYPSIAIELNPVRTYRLGGLTSSAYKTVKDFTLRLHA